MKTMLLIPALAALTGLSQGCATSRPQEMALVCPHCKVVIIESMPRAVSRDLEGIDRDDVFITYPENEIRHSCPGCQGSLVTLFKEGKLKHRCTICEQGPYSCPVAHR